MELASNISGYVMLSFYAFCLICGIIIVIKNNFKRGEHEQ